MKVKENVLVSEFDNLDWEELTFGRSKKGREGFINTTTSGIYIGSCYSHLAENKKAKILFSKKRGIIKISFFDKEKNDGRFISAKGSSSQIACKSLLNLYPHPTDFKVLAFDETGIVAEAIKE